MISHMRSHMSDIRIKVSYNIFTRVPGFEKMVFTKICREKLPF